jgi:hypothetical protein
VFNLRVTKEVVGVFITFSCAASFLKPSSDVSAEFCFLRATHANGFDVTCDFLSSIHTSNKPIIFSHVIFFLFCVVTVTMAAKQTALQVRGGKALVSSSYKGRSQVAFLEE